MNLVSFKRSAAPVVLLTSVWLVLADNGQFWQLISSVSASWNQPNPWFLVSIFIITLILVNLALTLLTFGRATRWILSALLCISAAAACSMDQYGIMFNRDMIQNIFETDLAESMELINLGLLSRIMFFGGLPALVVWRLVPSRQSISGMLAEKSIVLGISILLVVVVVTPFYKDYASLVRNHREVRYLLTPINYLQSLVTYAAAKAATPMATVSIGTDAHKGVRWTGVGRVTLTVLVVGETARADSFSLGSYSRNTNPRLADSNAIYFSNVSACGTSTRASLPCMFSDLTRADYSKDTAHNREGLLDVLNHAGIQTLWVDNNSGCKGVCVNSVTSKVSRSEVSGRCADDKCYDTVLLEELDKLVGSIEEDTVIVLHQNGSHGPSYYRRYPDEFRKFKPDCRSDDFADCTQEQIINSYDNTIYYTDYFLSQLIEMLNGYSEELNTAMLYVSDHGESLGEYGLYLHGAPYFIAPDTQTHVPMLAWLSSAYQQDYQIDSTCIRNRREENISHDNLFHSMLGLMQIITTAYDSKLDIFSDCMSSPVVASKGVATELGA